MDQITCSYSGSSSSSSSYQHPQKQKRLSKQSCHDSLHSVHQKPITKHFIAPLPPTPLKIYNVDSSEFKEAVRVLTSTPEFRFPSARRLKDKPRPPPLVLSTTPLVSKSTPPQSPPSPLVLDDGEIMSQQTAYLMSPDFCDVWNETAQTTSRVSSGMDYFGGLSPTPVACDSSGGALMSPLGFCLSPSSLSWCSSVLLNTGTLPTMNQSSVL